VTKAREGPVIQVENVSKRYRLYTERRTSLRERFVRMTGSTYEDFWALRNVSFEVDRGQTFGVIGHNGSGKSTLLRLMAGVHRATEGTVTARGRVGALLELGAGFHPDLTGRENVRLNAAILGIPKKYIAARMDEIAEFAGVEHFFDSPVKVYSSGMAMRLGFATAVHLNPEILLVDEAISVGDEEFQRKCMDHIFRLRQDGTTVVLVSHALPLVAELCDAALWLDGGQPLMVGQTDMVIDAYLQDVNTREVEAAEDAASDEGTTGWPPEHTHIGSGEILIRDAEFITADGRAVDTLLAGDPATVRIHYDAKTAVDDITFGLAFVTDTGTRVAGPNSGFGTDAVRVEPGSGVVEYHVDELLLQPARYRVSAAAVTRQHVVDHVEAGFEVTIRAAHAITEPGLVRLPGRWTVMQETL
jgi:ABC-2 type transport system ATP-binding protein/lipopolysaccharide transport system ATP-binding protein